MLWANYYLATHQPDRAAAKVAEAVERRPHDWQVHVQAGQVYRVAGKYDLMRHEAQAALASAPASQRDQVTQIIKQALGPTALEKDDDMLGGGDEDAGPGGLPSTGHLELGQGSPLLGGNDQAPSLGGGAAGPSLGGGGASGLSLGGGGGGSGQPLLMPGDQSKLHLRGPSQHLQLQLGH